MKTPIIAGLDEAGRGSWAGPVCAAALIFKKGIQLPGLTDSKLMTAKRRELLFDKIIQTCDHGIGFASEGEVDSLGLIRATELAFIRALEQLKTKPDFLLVDGQDKFNFPIPYKSIIKGDLKERCISAASVLAKVARDQKMKDYAIKHPEYGFEKHKGYGTARHQQALKLHGPSPLHRVSYKPVKIYL
jgi:ribonuclease HII